MTRPKSPVELNFADLVGPAAAAAGAGAEEAAAVTTGPETGGDFMAQVQGMMEGANAFINNIKELLSMWNAFRQGPAQIGPGSSQGKQPYAPQPTLMQEVHRVVNILYTAYGDITVAELLQTLVANYGGTKLSAVLKALEKIK